MELAAKSQLVDGEQNLCEGGSWESLCEHLHYHVLSHLPVLNLVRASLVSKHWRSIVASPSFIHLHSKGFTPRPWFFLYGINFLVPAKSQAFAYDPYTRKWHCLPLKSFPEHDQTSLAVSSGFLYAITASTHLQICHKHDLFPEFLSLTPPMNCSRRNPIVNFVEDSISDSYKVIVCGGVSVFEDEDLAVEIFDSDAGSWEVCAGLPGEFRGSSSAHWTTSVICKGRFFVHEMYSGSTAALDLHLKTWTPVHVLRPLGVRYSYLVSCAGNLLLAGTCSIQNRGTFALWKVDEVTLDCSEIGQMPEDLYSVFESEEEDKTVNLKCVAAGEMLYVFSLAKHNGYAVVSCQVSDDKCCWMQVPTLARSVNRFDNLVGLCAPVTLKNFF
ncbi:hypothetical protein O6H91_Y262700 [Diphasiastrum complanatum]|nr:hypothetical protein O6H91_Y262700 [Diphasiastrum complanatum]